MAGSSSSEDTKRFVARTCSVCLDDFKRPGESGKCLPCGHWYCNACIPGVVHFSVKCPECRGPVALPGMGFLNDEGVDCQRCRMWHPAEPAKRPTKCTNIAEHTVVGNEYPWLRRFVCSVHRKQTDELIEKPRPRATTKCTGFTAPGHRARPARQCARLADSQQTGLCAMHCQQILGVKSVPQGYRMSALDDARIKAFIDSARANN